MDDTFRTGSVEEGHRALLGEVDEVIDHDECTSLVADSTDDIDGKDLRDARVHQ